MNTTAPRFNFEKVGLGYRLWPINEEVNAELRLTRLKRSSQELHGRLQVRCNFAGVKTVNGILHSARFNLSSATTRASLAKILAGRTPGFEDMDWADALEALCLFVDEAETKGEPVVGIGQPVVEREHGRYALDPLVTAHVASLLYGPGGAGKSVLALAGALSIAVGREIIPGIPPAIKGPVLYLDWETDAYVVNERLWALCRGAKIEPANVSYRRCNRPLADDAEELSALVAELGVVYLVIDSCGPAMGTSGEYGDANESTLRLFEAIRHIGVTTQIVDHVSKQEMRSKSGRVTGLLPYGSIYKVNLARAAWELRNGTTENDDDLRISLFNTKANDARIHEPINLLVEWEPHEILFRPDIAAPTVSDEGEAVAASAFEMAKRYLDELGPLDTKLLAEYCRVTQGTVRNWVRQYPGQIVRTLDKKRWALPTSGQVAPTNNILMFSARSPES